MPPSLNTQRTIAFVWDFDKTITHDYMQNPLFEEYEIDPKKFWEEVNALPEKWEKLGLRVSKDTIYLGHILDYIAEGKFPGLSNSKLRELGGRIELAPGILDFMEQTNEYLRGNEVYAKHNIEVEHYIVSTGLRQMIEGSAIRAQVKEIWACELLPSSSAVSLSAPEENVDSLPLSSIGYTIDNTTKTRAVFEINKGINVHPSIDVNARMDDSERRVPFENMIYIADGPSDVPVFSVVLKAGGKAFGVHIGGFSTTSYKNVKQLQDDGRIIAMGPADYTQGSATYDMLMGALDETASRISEALERQVSSVLKVPGHIV